MLHACFCTHPATIIRQDLGIESTGFSLPPLRPATAQPPPIAMRHCRHTGPTPLLNMCWGACRCRRYWLTCFWGMTVPESVDKQVTNWLDDAGVEAKREIHDLLKCWVVRARVEVIGWHVLWGLQLPNSLVATSGACWCRRRWASQWLTHACWHGHAGSRA